MIHFASKPLQLRLFCVLKASLLICTIGASVSFGRTAMPKPAAIEGVVGGDYKVSIEPLDAKTLKPTAFKVGALQSAEIKILINNKAAKIPVLTSFDMTMPSHGHGMPTKSTFRKTSDLNYIAEGIQLSMRGEWVAELTLEIDGVKKELRIPFNMK